MSTVQSSGVPQQSSRGEPAALRVPFETPATLVHHHSHNDYVDEVLVDTLRLGFTSFEVDVWRTRELPEELLVGINWGEVSPPRLHRTLRGLYLDPLRAHLEATGNEPFPHCPGTRVQFLIDFKVGFAPGSSDPAEGIDDDEHARRRGYELLDAQLAEYSDIITEYGPDGVVQERPVSVVVTGDRPGLDYIHGLPSRYSAGDGRLNFLDEGDSDFRQSASLVPMISGKFDFNFRFPSGPERDEVAKLVSIYEHAERNGQRIRFWGSPDNRAIWVRLLELAGQRALEEWSPAIISTDRLAEFRQFIHPGETPLR